MRRRLLRLALVAVLAWSGPGLGPAGNTVVLAAGSKPAATPAFNRAAKPPSPPPRIGVRPGLRTSFGAAARAPVRLTPPFKAAARPQTSLRPPFKAAAQPPRAVGASAAKAAGKPAPRAPASNAGRGSRKGLPWVFTKAATPVSLRPASLRPAGNLAKDAASQRTFRARMAPWGGKYKYGAGEARAFRHIMERHYGPPRATATAAGRPREPGGWFDPKFTSKQIGQMIRQAQRKGDVQHHRTKQRDARITHEFPFPIGVSITGKTAYRLQVVIRDGQIFTAYPFD